LPDPPSGRKKLLPAAESASEFLAAQVDPEIFPVIPLRTVTYEKAKALLIGSGLDLYALESDWREWIAKTGNMPQKPDAAFLGFCRKKAKQR
jgi:hypothetical protein